MRDIETIAMEMAGRITADQAQYVADLEASKAETEELRTFFRRAESITDIAIAAEHVDHASMVGIGALAEAMRPIRDRRARIAEHQELLRRYAESVKRRESVDKVETEGS